MTEQSDDQAAWWRAELLSPPERAEIAAAALWSLGAGGVEVRDEETFFQGASDFAPVPDGQTRLIAFFELKEAEVEPLSLALGERSGARLLALIRFEDRSWETAWHAFFTPRLLAPKTRVGPPWEEFEAPEGGRKLVIEPGMAFGTGTHETTQLVSAELERLLLSNTPCAEAMLDVGCGSGVLCVLAAQLGVKRLLGLELREDTLQNARRNVELNGLQSHDIAFETTPLELLEGQWPLVVANIIAPVLLELSEALVAHTAPGGVLILSGVLAEQLGAIREAFTREGMRELGHATLEPWHALTYVRDEELER